MRSQHRLVVSRNRFFDLCAWPANLLFVPIANIGLAVCAWAILRRAARRVRREAILKIDNNLLGRRPRTGDGKAIRL